MAVAFVVGVGQLVGQLEPLRHADRLGDKPALIDAATGRTLRYRQLAAGVERVAAGLVARGFGAGDVLAIYSPNLPEYALAAYGAMAAGGIVTGANPMLTVDELAGQLTDAKARLLVTAPPFLDRALAAAELAGVEDSLGVGAAPLGADVEQCCADRLRAVTGQGPGMTEAGCLIAVGQLDQPRRGSVGRLVPNTEARTVDPDSLVDLGTGRTGELWVRGPQLMRGYRDRPEATAATIDADGWLHTGDLCYFDAEGYLYVVDRLKELIKYKGYQVAPAELEQLLLTHPAVADAAVVARPDPEAGEVPVAHVVLRGEATAEELLAYVAERVAPYKRLSAVPITEAVPRSPAGKLLRRVLVDAERAPQVSAPE